MQGLVDHTVDRILCDPKVVEKIRQIKEEHGSVSLEFIYKFGLDGSKVKLNLGGVHKLCRLKIGNF